MHRKLVSDPEEICFDAWTAVKEEEKTLVKFYFSLLCGLAGRFVGCLS